MLIEIETRLDYVLPGTADVLLQLEAAIIPEQCVLDARIALSPLEHFARVPGQDEIGERIWVRAAERLTVEYQSTVRVERLDADLATIPGVPPHLLPGPVVAYLFASRYCNSDSFEQFVNGEFCGLEGGARVAAIRDWIGANLRYEPGSSGPETTAGDTFNARQGVCRDYAHLMVALTRASGIPARYASVYGLGVEPQDFHAVAEVFIGDVWYLVDATGMTTAAGAAKIGVGRDAADVSFLTCFGEARMEAQSVNVRAV
ncbi:transglutaminase family protein [Novosphingobium colocasiae]|uniref:Transglutaminase n=1 Tax=Novosphingobium colocasiae TaxID=1256513 RepID=A0A918PHB7_9SPHN|nr:transglutaminase family protein [Novosphingobium colocasiae]GGZ07657.1 transglutaminase [Novosphingobium colocasiae]